MAYTPQFYPGSTSVGINRRKHMSGNLEKLRDIPEA
ncbi:MAG: coenzyme-B sulfoethylthiotransferase subunit gamma, partial [Methanothrix sp.]|nr:coenzyme-B sulfoethylthiotransferase subunit gamma [Methanothrix sp.]